MKRYPIVLASGAGERFGAFKTPKHLTPLMGVPVLIWTLKTITKSKLFEKIIILVREQDLILTQSYIDKYFKNIDITYELSLGGKTRSASFLCGFDHLNKTTILKPDDIICVFDSNRPLSPIKQLEDLSEAVNLYECVCPARSVVNGVAEIEGDFIVNVPEKSNYVEFVTPEFMKFGSLKEALNKKEFPCLVEYALSLGLKPFTVPSMPLNVKLTFPEDTTYLEGMIEKYQLAIPQQL